MKQASEKYGLILPTEQQVEKLAFIIADANGWLLPIGKYANDTRHSEAVAQARVMLMFELNKASILGEPSE